MSHRAIARGLAAWILATAVASLLVHDRFRIRSDADGVIIATAWAGGEVVGRAVLAHSGDPDPALDDSLAGHAGAVRVEERIVGRGPVVRWPKPCLAMSFVPGRDGIGATIGGRTAYVTPDELLARQAYDKDFHIPALQLSLGIDLELAIALLGARLGVSTHDVLDHADLFRFRSERLQNERPRAPTPATLTRAEVRDAAVAGARYLARGVDDRGQFRYMVDAPTNRLLPGYDFPRHAGATYFLAQVAGMTGDASIAFAALRAAAMLRDEGLTDCGAHVCVGRSGDARVDLGSSALTLLAFVEIARTRIDPGDDGLLPRLAAFLRSQQRPDGEFMHFYDRAGHAPVDEQTLYYSGEAALALSRTYGRLGDRRDYDASMHALDHLVHGGWNFFGSRYYWGEEHWTCQAMDDLWDGASSDTERAILRDALAFCVDWAAYGRKLMYDEGDSSFDADGAYGFSPVITPRLTPAGSRAEAVLATLDAGRRAGLPASQRTLLEDQLRRSLAMLLRHQFLPGPTHLFADPSAVEGAMPATEVDWALRIDYTQHAGSAFVRWLEIGRAL